MSDAAVVREFPATTLAVRQARAFVVEQVPLLGDSQVMLATLVSEAASNAVLHAKTPFRVEVTVMGDRLRVRVTDESPQMPVQKGHSLTATTGRGLRIIEALATEWGVVADDAGKTLWFEYDLAGDDDG